MPESIAPHEAPEVELLPPPEVETELDPPYRVVLHNDEVTPWGFVVVVLRIVFNFDQARAEGITLEAHQTGLAHVTTLPKEQAKYCVGKAHGMARDAGHPLTFSLEPAQNHITP